VSSTEERNAKDDLALCDKATPGPWEYDGMHNEIQTPRGETCWLIVSECRSAPDQGYPDDYSDVPQYDANFDFIAMAREALPYWIERAVAAEKKIAELIADLYERDLALQVESEALGNAEAWADKLEKALEQTFKRRGMEEFVACWKEYFLEGDSDA